MRAGTLLVGCVALLACTHLVVGFKFGDFTGNEYQAKSAQEKSDQIWQAITEVRENAPWPWSVQVAQIFIQNMYHTMDTESDELPYQYFQMSRRPKLIHSVGSVSKIIYKPKETSPYSGVFGDMDGVLGFARCSLAKYWSPGKEYTPGCGVKFMRSGRKSGNFVAMVSLTGQTSLNFFKNPFTNHVPDLQPGSPLPQQLLKMKFKTVSAWPNRVGLSDIAKYDGKGNEAVDLKVPFSLSLVPFDEIRNAFGDDQTGDHVAQLSQHGHKDAQTPLWTVMARSGPGEGLKEIGEIIMDGKFVPSKWGDEEMFFQHQRIDDDVNIHPEWNPDVENQLHSFDMEPDEPVPMEVTDPEVTGPVTGDQVRGLRRSKRIAERIAEEREQRQEGTPPSEGRDRRKRRRTEDIDM